MKEVATMDSTIIIILLIALLAALAIWGVVSALRKRNRLRKPAETAPATIPPDPWEVLAESLKDNLAAMNTSMQSLNTTLNDSMHTLMKQDGQTLERLEAVGKGQENLTTATNQLQNLLSDNQHRGYYGERLADIVIEAAGYQEGVSYYRHIPIKDQPGDASGEPDFSFLLPGDRLMHMDVKFPLTNYKKYLDTEDEMVAKDHLHKFYKDVETKMKEILKYADDENGVGFVLMYIPVESIWSVILSQKGNPKKPSLWTLAEKYRVVLCSPTTLLSILLMVNNLTEAYRVIAQGQNLIKAARLLEKRWNDYNSKMDEVKGNFKRVHTNFTNLLGARATKLQESFDELRALHKDDQEAPAEPSDTS